MSEQPSLPRPGPRRRFHPAMMILLIGLGILLLFPGLCSLAIIVYLADINPKNLLDEGLLVGLWLATFLVAAGGVLLIRHAIRGRAV